MAKKRKKKRHIADFNPKAFTSHAGAQDFYDWANQKYFKYQLPNVAIGFYKEKDMDYYGCSFTPMGARHVHTIALNPKFKEWSKVVKITILHEMVHVKLRGLGGHGPRFQKELHRLVKAGAFNQWL